MSAAVVCIGRETRGPSTWNPVKVESNLTMSITAKQRPALEANDTSRESSKTWTTSRPSSVRPKRRSARTNNGGATSRAVTENVSEVRRSLNPHLGQVNLQIRDLGLSQGQQMSGKGGVDAEVYDWGYNGFVGVSFWHVEHSGNTGACGMRGGLMWSRLMKNTPPREPDGVFSLSWLNFTWRRR